jgi:O-antigen ligase
MATRLRVIAVAAVALPIGFAAIPQRVIDRYTTMFATLGATSAAVSDPATQQGEEPDEMVVDSATASANSRIELLKRSIRVTLANPVLGVGPGMFVVAENEMSVADGRRRGYWKASHNMYTQISSEVGLPGAFVFVYLMVLVWRSLSRAEKAHPSSFSFAPEMRRIGFMLKVSMLVFILCGMTLSMGYGIVLPMLCGWSIAIDRLLAAGAWKARTESEAEQVESPAPAAAPAYARIPLTASPRN